MNNDARLVAIAEAHIKQIAKRERAKTGHVSAEQLVELIAWHVEQRRKPDAVALLLEWVQAHSHR